MSRWNNKELLIRRPQIVYMRDTHGMSFGAIGRYFGKDHTSIIMSYYKAKKSGMEGVYIDMPVRAVKEVKKCKYENLFEVTNGSDYDEIVKKSDKVTKMLAKMTHGERSYRGLSRRKCFVK